MGNIDVQIQAIVNDVLNQQPKPMKCKIKKVYSDNFVDIVISNQILNYVRAYGGNINEDSEGVLFVIENGDFIVIT